MKKRILSIVLSIVMLVGLLPTTALAMPSHSHCVCGGSVTVGGHTHENITSWVAWDGKDRDSETPGDQLTAGSYYLNDNVDVDVTIVGEVNLCLNGRTITTTNGYGAFHVKSGATLNICDCSTSLPGKIENTNASTDYPGIRNNGGTVNVYGGTVSGAHTGIINKNNNGGTVNVYGGTVSGTNTGIKNEKNSNLNIYNGTAQATGSTGYGIYNQGTVSVSGGIVTGGSNGIRNYYTGTINVSGTVQVSGTTGIYNDGGTFNVSGGTVTAIGNSGSGIYNSGTGTLTVSGGTVTANNGSSKGISNSGTLNLQGAPSITGAAADIYLNSDKLITIGEGGLTYTSDKAISVKMSTPGTFTTGWTTKMGENADYDSYFTSANDGYIVQPDGSGELKLAAPITYTVTYNRNGATSGDVPADSNSPYISGSTVTVLGNTGNLAKTGYAFVGWNTWSNGYGTDYAPGAPFNINSNTTLYAQWEEYEITSQPVENDPSVGTNADSDIASYQWYKGTMSDVTTENASAYTSDEKTSSYSDGWWTCHEAGVYSTPGYFTIVLNAGDSILAQTSSTINEGQLGIVGSAQDWDWTTPDDHFLVTAPADGNYDLRVSDVTSGSGTQPTVKAQVFHIGSTPADGATSKTLVADEDGWYACKITYKDGTVLYSGPVEYEAPSIPVTDVTLDQSNVKIYLDKTGSESANLTATVEPGDATNKAVTWSSENAAVATVDQNGVVTAVGKGYTTITATAADGSGKSDSLYVYVYEKIESVTINVTPPVVGETVNGNNFSENSDQFYIHTKWWNDSDGDVTVEAGKSYKMKVVLAQDNYHYFDSSTTASIVVDGQTITEGVTFEAAATPSTGSVYYTFTTEAPKANSIDIYLNDDPVTSEQSLTLPGKGQANNQRQYTVKVLDQYGHEMTNPTVEWSITQATGVSVDTTGLVSVTEDAAEGAYTLTATCDGKSDSITIKVEKAESVAAAIKIFKDGTEISEDTIYIPENGRNSAIYTAEVYDQYGDTMTAEEAGAEWSHENKDPATGMSFGSAEVDDNDLIRKVYIDASTGKAGVFDLVITSDGKRASVRITFAYLETQTITCANVTGTYGQTEELKLNPSGKQTAGAYSFAIKSGASTDVVEVASDGKLTIKNAGETTIVVTAPSDATHASASVEVKVTIDKADITEYTDPTANDLTYNGSAQALITEGSATGGSMMYAIGTAEQVTGEWSTDIPTGTDIGTYYVWYKVVGDRNHNDKTFETPITVTIAPNTYIVTYLPGINGTGTQTTDTKTQGVVLTLRGAIFTRTGYTQTGWATTDGGNQAYALGASYTADAPITLYPVWTANTNTVYTVEHWQQNVERTGYVKVDTDEKTGTTGAETVAAAKTYTGFTAQSFNQVAIAADGGTVVKIYYNRNTYTVTYTDNGVFLSNVTFEDVVYGAKAPAYPDTPTRTGYTFGGWYKDSGLTTAWDFENDTINGPTTIYAKWTEKNAVSITETAQTYTWDGNPKSFAITGTPNTGFTVQYKVNGNWTTTAPSAVGTYDVKITRAEDDTYKAYEKIITGGLVINAATPTATAPTAKTGLVYDGNAKSLINAGTSEHGYWEYSLDGTSYSSDIPTGTDAKTYTVYCRFVPNTGYANIDPVELSVTIDPMAVDEPTVVGSYTYTGSEQTVTLNGFNDSYMTIAGNKGTNAGGYEVVITLDSNHTWNTGSDGRVQWSIGKAEPTVTWPTGTAYVNDTSVTLTNGCAAGVGGENVDGRFTLDTIDLTSAGEKTVTITFTPTDTNYGGVVKMDYTVTVSKRIVESAAEQTPITNVVYGTEQNALGLPASVEITVSGNKKFTVPVEWSGYDATDLNAQTLTGTLDLPDIAAEVQQPDPAITASIVVDLQEKNAAAFSFENKTETYSGSPISHEISGGLDGVASISYSYESSEYAASSTAPTNAGVYEVTAIFTMEVGYASVAPKTATLTINPREVGLDWSALTDADLVYSGTAKALTATATCLADGDSCTVTVELVGDNINVGTFSYEATALSNANYKLPADVSSPEYTITPKTLTITADSHEVYVGSRQPELTYTIDGLVGTDTLTTAPTLSTDANMYRAGTYAIAFASEAAADNNYSITYVNGTLTVKNYPYIPQPTYDVEIADDITGGEVSASKKLAYSGDTITITVAPNAGYELAKLTVTDSRNNVVAVTKISDSKYTFKMPGYDVEIDAVFAKIDTTCPRDWTCPMYGYTDLDRTLWYHDGIHYCIEHGLMVGTGTNIFEPNIATSRAMIVTILWRLEGSPIVNYAMSFEDVAADQWYTEAIRWAASEKIVEGYGNGCFGTNDAITREQMVTIMFRYAKYKGYDVSVGENTNILSYDDAFDVAEWAIPAMQWACGSGMIQGIADGNQMNLAPQGNATRAQAAAILQRFCENVAKEK